jgi:hypothetical protein
MSNDRKEAGGVIMHLDVPAHDYELLKAAGKRAFRSPNREALWRLRRSLTRTRRKPATGAEAV